MGTKANERQTPIALPVEKIRELRKVALDLQAFVPRERAMDRGPMLGYLARWFLTIPHEEQLRVILAGKQVADQEENEPIAQPSPTNRAASVPPVPAEEDASGWRDIPMVPAPEPRKGSKPKQDRKRPKRP